MSAECVEIIYHQGSLANCD